jgi:hypothetical protein
VPALLESSVKRGVRAFAWCSEQAQETLGTGFRRGSGFHR